MAILSTVDQLKADHRQFEKLRDRWDALDEGSAEEGPLIEAILDALELHGRLETDAFYPVCRRLWMGNPEPLDDAADDHAEMETLIQEIRLRPAIEDKRADFERLLVLVRDHIEEEENILFRNYEDIVSQKDDEAIAKLLAATKADLQLLAEKARKAA